MLKEEGTGYFDTWISWGRTGSKSKHNLPEILPVGDVTVGRRHLRKRKRAVDHDPDLARLDPCENLVQLRDRARLFHEKSGDRKAGGFPPLRKRCRQVARASAEAAQRDEAPARGQDAEALCERLTADRLHNGVDTTALGEAQDLACEILVSVIDCGVRTELAARAHFSSLPAVANTRAPKILANCTAKVPMPLPPAWMNTRSPAFTCAAASTYQAVSAAHGVAAPVTQSISSGKGRVSCGRASEYSA